MVKKINHIGIAVHSIEESASLYRDVYGMHDEGIEVVEEQKVKVAFFAVGESRIELLEPTSEDSPVAKFIAKNGPGVHHIAYEVEDVCAEIERLKGEGIRLIDDVPRCGAHHTQIAFLHPKSSGGVLTEMCQMQH
ncbi:MAG: methylmalonyl-CoA epimerase [Desulfuromonadales bacterium C00003068]|jgi:methylmalonyl-CoA/ethylmalonyl-CoA epimerase|nr:methylmalonyl-CoA epimerase [Deltaproteobacteria bacterium]OEU75880.1 MAG: methylmalonyl-CoA epimerase [Desulfuromonadales bacterium C00003068]